MSLTNYLKGFFLCFSLIIVSCGTEPFQNKSSILSFANDHYEYFIDNNGNSNNDNDNFNDSNDDFNANNNTNYEVLIYQDWCLQWELNCTDELMNFPFENNPWEPEQWEAMIKIVKSFLNSKSSISIYESILYDLDLTLAAEYLGLDEFLQEVFAKLEENQWESISTYPNDGKITITNHTENELITPSGITLLPKKELFLTPQNDARIDITGLSMYAPLNSVPDNISYVDINQKNVFRLFSNNYNIQDIPMSFLEDLFDINLVVFPYDPQFNSAIKTAGPLLSFLARTQASLVLELDFWETVDNNIHYIIDEPTSLKTISAFTNRLHYIESVNNGIDDKGQQNAYLLGHLKPNNQIDCLVGASGSMGIIFSKKFGIDKIEVLPDTQFRLYLYGISGWKIVGWFKPAFTPRIVDVTPDYIIIYDVPFVGTYKMPLSEIKDIRCY